MGNHRKDKRYTDSQVIRKEISVKCDEISIELNLKRVEEKIKDACGRAGRNPSEVTLVAVSKTKPFSDILEARKAGAKEFGENYVQEMMNRFMMGVFPVS